MTRCFCEYKEQDNLEEVFFRKISFKDIFRIQQWVKFDRAKKINFTHNPERANFMSWDSVIKNIHIDKTNIYKVISKVKRSRIEALISLEINSFKEIVIHSLEVAPWNREIYLADDRDFRKLGLILIGFSILFGYNNNFCGIIRLESLDIRQRYYREGLKMLESPVNYSEFYYTKDYCDYFLNSLIQIGYIQI